MGKGVRKLSSIVLLAGACWLAGCGGGATTTQSNATESPTARPTPTATPTPDVRLVAAQQYLQMASRANQAGAAVDQHTVDGTKCGAQTYPNNTVTVGCFKQYLAVDAETLKEIYAIVFPSDMRADVNALISAQTRIVSDETMIVSSPNNDAAWNALQTDESVKTAAANVVRHDLGLPPVPTQTP